MEGGHRTYDELDDPHAMACDCACACDNLHLHPGSSERVSHVAACGEALAICDLHLDESTVQLADSMHLHLD